MSKLHLEPCPFCWSALNLRVVLMNSKHSFAGTHRHAKQIHCKTCGARGPSDYRGFDHIGLWNEISMRLRDSIHRRAAE